MDKLSTLMSCHALNVRIFHDGAFCGSTAFAEDGHSGQLHLVRSGVVRFDHADGSVVRAAAPALVFYPRGLAHRLTVAPDAPANLLCANMAFEGGSENLLARALPAVIEIDLAGADLLHRTVELLFAEGAAQQSGQEIILNSLCNVLIAQIIRRLFEYKRLSPGILAGLADLRLSRALQAIHDAPAQRWRVDSLAIEAGMSRSRFAQHFLAIIGTTPVLYLTEWRMHMAQDLLRSGLSVGAVSDAVGYANQPAFTRAFNEFTGSSPRRWLCEARRGAAG